MLTTLKFPDTSGHPPRTLRLSRLTSDSTYAKIPGPRIPSPTSIAQALTSRILTDLRSPNTSSQPRSLRMSRRDLNTTEKSTIGPKSTDLRIANPKSIQQLTSQILTDLRSPDTSGEPPRILESSSRDPEIVERSTIGPESTDLRITNPKNPRARILNPRRINRELTNQALAILKFQHVERVKERWREMVGKCTGRREADGWVSLGTEISEVQKLRDFHRPRLRINWHYYFLHWHVPFVEVGDT